MGYYEGDLCLSNGNGNSNNGWGDWSWIIGLAIIGALFGGNGGFGFGGGNRGGSDFAGWQLGRLATTNDVASGFSTSEIMSDLNDIILGQATMQNFINQGFSGLNSTVNTSTASINNAICTLGYQNAQLINGLSRELADCCCTTQRNIDSVRYDMSKGFCDVIRAGQDNTRAILDYLTGEKISALQAENSGLKAQISNDAQSRYIISELSPCPKPAYLTCNPNAPLNYSISYGNGCGCGSF